MEDCTHPLEILISKKHQFAYEVGEREFLLLIGNQR